MSSIRAFIIAGNHDCAVHCGAIRIAVTFSDMIFLITRPIRVNGGKMYDIPRGAQSSKNAST